MEGSSSSAIRGPRGVPGPLGVHSTRIAVATCSGSGAYHLHRDRALSSANPSSGGQSGIRETGGWLPIRGGRRVECVPRGERVAVEAKVWPSIEARSSSRKRRQLRFVRGLEGKGSSIRTTRVRVQDSSASRGRGVPRDARFGWRRRRRGCGQFVCRSVFRVERGKRPRGRCDGGRSTPGDRGRVEPCRRSSTGARSPSKRHR